MRTMHSVKNAVWLQPGGFFVEFCKFAMINQCIDWFVLDSCWPQSVVVEWQQLLLLPLTEVTYHTQYNSIQQHIYDPHLLSGLVTPVVKCV